MKVFIAIRVVVLQKERAVTAAARVRAAALTPESPSERLSIKDSSIAFSVPIYALPLARAVPSDLDVRYVITLTGPYVNLKSSGLLYSSLGKNLAQFEKVPLS